MYDVYLYSIHVCMLCMTKGVLNLFQAIFTSLLSYLAYIYGTSLIVIPVRSDQTCSTQLADTCTYILINEHCYTSTVESREASNIRVQDG